MDWRVRSVAQLLVLGFLLAIIKSGTAEQRVVCYYTNWSVYRPGTAKFSPQNINPYLCTHLIYAFGGFTKENTLKPFDKYQDIEKGGYAKFTGLKTYNKNLKTMLAVGGWNEGSARFSPMVADPERRKEFVRNTVKFLRQNHFDGLDLDWEYPAFRDGGKPRDRDNYASLVQELREAYERESSKTGRPRLLLSMAVPAGIEYINKGYDIPKLNKYLDFINLLSYDYHSSYEPAVNHHSPLYPLEEDNEYNFDTELTVDYTIKHLLDMGASADKIVLGIPTYGRSYTLFNEDATDIGSPADGPGEEGDATREKGYLAYYEICEALIESEDWEVVSPNPNAMGPYAYKGNQWVGYDDEAIVKLKAQYVNERGLGGIMFWSIDNDDFRGKCHDRPYPLIEAAKEAMLTGSEKTSSAPEKSSKPVKTRTDGNSIGRRLPGGRRRTTEATLSKQRPEGSRKRVNSLRSRPQSNLDERETQVQVNGRNRGQFFSSEEEKEDEDESSNTNAVRSIPSDEDQDEQTPTRPQNSKRPRNGQGRRRRPESNRRRSTTEANPEEPVASQGGNHRVTTPAPPTTPDPGTDFKCEDEGFFSHPRDCKKYFWCLDAGPGGLGIVAHHFTCPAGLVFNKAADSCDYPRNVVCPKANTEGPTTRAPIIAATSRTTRIHSTTRRSSTTSTTTPSEYSEEYEYYDDEDELDEVPVTTTTARTLQYKTISRTRPTTTSTTAAPSTTSTPTPRTTTSRSYQAIPPRSSSVAALSSIEETEEDPKVIQELIELIKKAGGIEELEKQLHLQGKGSESSGQSSSVTSGADVTPATISRSLYERVLNRQAANGGSSLFRRTTFAPSTVTTEIPERLDPQPSIAQRSKPAFRNGPGQAQFEGLDDIPEVKSLRREKPQYVTITRQRPSTEAPDETSEEIVSDNSDGASSDQTSFTNPPEAKPSTQKETHGYVDIRRSRTSTARSDIIEDDSESNDRQQRRRPVTADSGIEDEDEDGSKNSETSTEAVVVRRRNQFPVQEETSGTTSRYHTIQRVRSTTQASEETSSEEDVQVLESTTKSSSSSADIITTTSPIDKIDDKIPIPETIAAIERTTTPVVETASLTQTPITVSTDLPGQNIDPSTTLLPITEKAVEESSVIASSASTEETTSDEPVTKGSTAVPQPRPFVSQRRTRPTTTATTATLTSTPETTTSSVSSESGRVKVPSETVRLPTLKELIGHNTIVAHDYTTTTPITLSIRILHDENAVSKSEHNKISQTVTPAYEKEISKEEIEGVKATGINEGVNAGEENQTNKYTTLETTTNNEYTNDVRGNSISNLDKSTTSAVESSLPPTLPIRVLKQDKIKPRRRRIKFVNIPIRILESDRPVTDLILEVPEYKLNSVLRSLLRVEIIDNNNATSSGKESKDVNTYSQRTRYNANQNYSEDSLSTDQESNALPNKDANANFHVPSENQFTTTTPSISTIRGSRLFTPSHSRTGGFYVTKSIESNTLLENVTPQISSRGTELDNELNQPGDQLSTSNHRQSTLTTSGDITTESYHTEQEETASQEINSTTEQLSNLDENLSSITEGSVTTINDYYTVEKEGSRSPQIWPSVINTSRENLNNILANNDDVDSAEMVTQKITFAADDSSTEYLSFATEEVDFESKTEVASTESDTSNSEETFGLHSTEQSYTAINNSSSDPAGTITTDTETRINTIIDESDFYTEIPDIQRTTTDQDTYFTTESSTSSFGATESSTGFNSYADSTSKLNLQKETTSDFEGTSDSTEVSSTETNVSVDDENTITHDVATEFNTETNRYTEINTIESRSGFGVTTVTPESVSDYKSTTFINYDDDSVTTDSASETTGSVSNPDVETATVSSIDSETSILDFTTTSSISTDSPVSDLITTHDPFATTADETEADIFTTSEIATTDLEVKTTEESTTESVSIASVTKPTSVDHESATQQSEVSQTVNTLVTSGSESTFSPSSNANEITTVRKEEPVNETESAQAPKPSVVAQSSDSELTSRGFYRSPTAVPGKKTIRRRVVKKRIYGIRRPLVETVADNETAAIFPRFNFREKLNRNNDSKRRFVRRRIINHSTGKVVLDEIFKRDSMVLENQDKMNNSNPELVEKVEDSSKPKNNLVRKLLRHRTTYRRQPEKNQTNSSIQANISSQNNSASNDVQSSSVSSTNPNQRRRTVIKRFRYRQSTVSPSPSPSPSPSSSSSSSPPSLFVADAVGQLNTTESTIDDKLQEDKRRTSRQDYNDDTIDNLSSGSENYGTVSVHGEEELPRTESISEALLESEDEQSSGEINLFKTRAISQRKPGTLLRASRLSTTTPGPENEEPATTLSSTKAPSQIPTRRRLRLGQRTATSSSNAITQNQTAQGDGEVLKSGREDESLDQIGHAQESEVTVADEIPTSPSPSVSTGRPPFRTSVRRRIITTEVPQLTVPTTHQTIIRQRQRPNAFDKIPENQPVRPRRPAVIDYDYYEDSEESIVGKPRLSGKLSFTASGSIRCLDQGNFPHPSSCKKFITCARMVDGQVIGTEYTCPKRLSFDPVGGICNWSAGLGCRD